MAALSFCEWPYEACCPDDITVDQTHIDMAGFMLWKATGSQFGPCETTIRPCGAREVCCARCGESLCCDCQCYSPHTLIIPGPVNSISEITIGGVVVDPANYRVDDWNWLVNLVEAWPSCPEDLIITYERGLAPPPGAALVAGELACELAKAFCNDSTCRLPRNIQSATRQGITVNYSDMVGFLPNVSGWVNTVNDKTAPSTVWSPDMPQYRQTTWTSP